MVLQTNFFIYLYGKYHLFLKLSGGGGEMEWDFEMRSWQILSDLTNHTDKTLLYDMIFEFIT